MKSFNKPIQLISIDVESDGPCPGLYSMVSFGAVTLYTHKTFKGLVAPISDNYIEDALKVSSITREQHCLYPPPEETMVKFGQWLEEICEFHRPVMVSDNPAFDWQFINYYLWRYYNKNPLGFSARRIGDFAAGLNNKWSDHTSWKKLRTTKHTHDPVDDALGNAGALEIMLRKSQRDFVTQQRNDINKNRR